MRETDCQPETRDTMVFLCRLVVPVPVPVPDEYRWLAAGLPMAASILRVITRQTDSALAKPGSHHLRLSPCLDSSCGERGKLRRRLEKV